MKKCCFWVLGVIQWFRANVLGELGCTCVAAHWNILSLLCYALLSDRDRRAMSCCFIAVGQSYKVPLQASQSSLFLKLIKIAGSGPSFLPHSLCDLFSLLAVVWKLFCRALFLVFSFVSFSLVLCLVLLFFFCLISQGTALCLNKTAFMWEERHFFNGPYWHRTSYCATC